MLFLFVGGQAAVGGADFNSLRLYAVQDPEVLKSIDEESAKRRPGSHPIYGAPTLIVLATKASILPNIEFTNAGCVLGYAEKEFKKPKAEEQRIEVAYI